MKKTIKYILFALMLLVLGACVREFTPESYDHPDNLEYPSEGKAIINMSVRLPIHVTPETRAFGESPDSLGYSTLRNMRVAVFGSSGFLKETVDITKNDFTAARANGDETLYNFSVHLSLSDSKNLHIHVMANCTEVFPWKYESVVMSEAGFTSGQQDAYWCRFELPNGITLKKEYNQETESMEYVKIDNYYQVTDDVTDAFKGGKDDQGNYKGLPMLRNFAKISVESTTPQLELDPVTTMAVINRPDCGSVAPYNPETEKFVDDYYLQIYDSLKVHYPGFSPSGMKLVDSDPSASGLFKPCTVDAQGNVSGGIYMYERPKPQGSYVPTYIIVHGVYHPLKENLTYSVLPQNWKDLERATPGTYLDMSDAKAVDGYYKLDLMDDDGYYAIFRNFRYHIRISNVSREGAETPEEAGSTGGSGDISTSTESAQLTDISDGYGRIAVSFVQMTFVEGQAVMELKYKFIPNVEAGDVQDNRLESEGGAVSISVSDPTGPISVFSSAFDSSFSGASGVEIGDSTKGKIKVLTGEDDSEGYRTIKFTVNTPSQVSETRQKITILGQIDQYKKVSREVEFILMKRQDMVVECIAESPHPDYDTNSVENIPGEGINVSITIPINLPESMFPLIFNIESDQLSITPNSTAHPEDNLPVETGYSICEGKESQKSFHFVRTLSWDDYDKLPDHGGKTITCHFKTNKAASASTIYVTNEYFNRGSADFVNHSMFHFKNMYFSNYRAAAGTNLTFHLELDASDNTRPRTVRIQLEGLLPQNTSSPWGIVDAANGIYSYDVPRNTTSVDLALKTLSGTSYTNQYSVNLSAKDGNGKAAYREEEIFNMAYNVISIDAPSEYAGTNTTRHYENDVVRVDFSSARQYTNPNYIQAQSGSSMTVYTTNSKTIVSVILTFTGTNNNYVGGTPTVNAGSYSRSGTTGRWVGQEVAPIITFGSNNTARISNITVVYEVGN